jgi:hypothetical protein
MASRISGDNGKSEKVPTACSDELPVSSLFISLLMLFYTERAAIPGFSANHFYRHPLVFPIHKQMFMDNSNNPFL